MTSALEPHVCGRHGHAGDGDACDRDLPFPRCPENRPGLPRIERRIGAYPEIRAFLVDRLNHDPTLRRWTHRQPDDPGIALLEGTAILGDILTFYQELYANEAYLRTAAWRESVAALVKLLGYRLSPGVGGRAVLAVEVRGPDPITVPAGFPLTAQVTGLEGATDLATTNEIVAYPWLGRFSLCRPLTTPVIGRETRELVVATGPDNLDLQKGQRLLLGPGGSALDWSIAEIVVIDSVRQRLGETLVTIRGGLRQIVPDQALVAYRIGRSFRHFGHNAPPQTVVADSAGKAQNTPVSLKRNLAEWTTTYQEPPEIAPTDVPLDATVPDLTPGSLVICQVTPPPLGGEWSTKAEIVERASAVAAPAPPIAPAAPNPQSDFWSDTASFIEDAINSLFGGGSSKAAGPPLPPGKAYQLPARLLIPTVETPRTAVRTIVEVRQASLTWGSLTGASTVIALDAPLASDSDIANIGDIQIHEATSPRLRLVAAEVATGDASGLHVGFVGTADEVSTLVGRRLLLVPPAGPPSVVTVQAVDPATAPGLPAAARRLRSVRLDVVVPYADLGPDGSPIVVHGNVVDATQGKLEREEPIGSGDARAVFQTMPIPKEPLTYLTTPGNTPPETPELEVFVDRRRWRRVASLFGSGPTEEVYIVREDDEGQSWIQFGDGKTGARLPSGIDNVVVRYRTGVAAHGPLRPDTSVQVGARLDRLDKVRLPGEVTGGDEAEDGDSARDAAPGKVQGLDRLVSLRDFETETLAIPGVSRVRAAWRLVDNVPAAVVTVLMDTGRESEIDQVRGIVAISDRRRGASRFPVVVLPGRRRFFRMTLQVATDGTLRDAEVLDAVRRELRVAGLEGDEDGTASRGFGEREHATSLEGRVQQVAGVVWTRVERMELTMSLVEMLGRSGRIGQLGRLGRLGAGTALGPTAKSGALRLAASAVQLSPARLRAIDALEERVVTRLGGARLRDLEERFGRQPLPTRVLTAGPDEILALRDDDLAIALVTPPATGTDR